MNYVFTFPRPAVPVVELDTLSGLPLPPKDATADDTQAFSCCVGCAGMPRHARCSGCPRPSGLESIDRNEVAP